MPKFSKAYLEARYEQALIVVTPGKEVPTNIDACTRVLEPIPIRGNELDANGKIIPIWPFEDEGETKCQPT